MADRALVLVGLVGITALIAVAYGVVRRRRAPELERLDVDELGLELIAGCCAFVVFTTPACRPCRAVLNVVRAATEGREPAAEVTTVDAITRSDLALRYAIRSVPTTFLITASGHVVQRWVDVPHRADVERALRLAAA